MLIQFSLCNYKNFKDPQVLDFSEGKISEHPGHLLKNPIDRLGILPTAIIYGPNGSGKSNFLKSILHLRSLVLDAPSVLEKDCRFAFDSDSRNTPLEYEIIFRCQDFEFDYQLRMTSAGIKEENLFGRKLSSSTYDVLFDRDSDGVFLCKELEQLDVSALTDRQPLLYFLGRSQIHQVLQPVFDFFQNIIFLSGDNSGQNLIPPVLESENDKAQILSWISEMNLTVTDIYTAPKGFTFVHTIGEQQLTVNWEEESSGTRRILTILCAILEARRHGSLILADDPELHLHPMLLEKMYRIFTETNPETSGAQLIAATHENSTMNNGLFRRDELWITDPRENGSSILYPLSLYLKENGEKVRKDETYSKQYLEGRYGGIPRIK